MELKLPWRDQSRDQGGSRAIYPYIWGGTGHRNSSSGVEAEGRLWENEVGGKAPAALSRFVRSLFGHLSSSDLWVWNTRRPYPILLFLIFTQLGSGSKKHESLVDRCIANNTMLDWFCYCTSLFYHSLTHLVYNQNNHCASQRVEALSQAVVNCNSHHLVP
jgi:hypothetical protein